ncbi:MAG: cytochrome-c peroxidase [Salibacteraceae bacterium]
MKLSFFFLIAIVFSLFGCKNDLPEPVNPSTETPYQTTPLTIPTPKDFPEMIIPEENPLTLEGVSLGRMLYYDKIMDKDSSRACASCHLQDQAFQIDNGTNQVVPHMNMGWSNNFMWSGGFTGTLEDVMTFEVEVFFETNLDRLNNSDKYRDLFKKAFNVDTITSKEAAYALAQFARIMTTSNSKYDQFARQELNLTPEEMRGFMLFFTEKADCFHCHGSGLFTDNTPRNNGLDLLPDSGLMAITKDPNDLGKFKAPTLRNIEHTAPYMHDGRFNTLKEVLDFYATGVQHNPTIDALMIYSADGGNKLTETEKEEVIAFLKTLSDPDFLTNSELSNPF